MKLTLPEPKMELYETGFEDGDFFKRNRFSQKLSELVEKIEDPCVIAIDGHWGSGKSYFLKRWVGAHSKKNGGKALTVYFDAFEHDFLDDPLVGLVGVISDRFDGGTSDRQGIWKTGKKIISKLLRPTVRIGAAWVTGGVSELAGPAVDGMLAGVKAEVDKSSEDFWKREDGKRAAISEFRTFLADLTAPNADDESNRIVVVVDELDRCRPDYALALLETIKHFFAVPNVHFILGVNLRELENVVKSRYGIETAARDYIRKFVTIRIQLPNIIHDDRNIRDWQIFFNDSFAKMGLDALFCQEVSKQLKWVHPKLISLRAIQRLLSEVAVLPKLSGQHMALIYLRVSCSLLLLKFFEPSLFEKSKSGTLKIEDLAEVFAFNADASGTTQETIDSYRFYVEWCVILRAPQLILRAPQKDALDSQVVELVQQALSYASELKDLRPLIRECLEFADLGG